MNSLDLIILNFEEVRRRSVKVWRGIPQQLLDWRPDAKAMSCKHMIRHVLEGEWYYHQIILKRGSVHTVGSPYESQPFNSVEEELAFSKPYREDFFKTIRSFKEGDLRTVKIDRSDVGYIRSLGDMFLRIAYHESVHTGQMLQYLRIMQIERPHIWD